MSGNNYCFCVCMCLCVCLCLQSSCILFHRSSTNVYQKFEQMCLRQSICPVNTFAYTLTGLHTNRCLHKNTSQLLQCFASAKTDVIISAKILNLRDCAENKASEPLHTEVYKLLCLSLSTSGSIPAFCPHKRHYLYVFFFLRKGSTEIRRNNRGKGKGGCTLIRGRGDLRTGWGRALQIQVGHKEHGEVGPEKGAGENRQT